MSNVHFHFRIAPEELISIKAAALKARQTPSEFARDAVFERLGKVDRLSISSEVDLAGVVQGFVETTHRLVALDESLDDIKSTLMALGQRLEVLGIGAIASSAMLIDTGKLGDEAATAKVVAHIDEALDVAPGILDRQRDLARTGQT